MSVVGFSCECVFGWALVCVQGARGSAGLMAAPLDGEQGTGGG